MRTPKRQTQSASAGDNYDVFVSGEPSDYFSRTCAMRHLISSWQLLMTFKGGTRKYLTFDFASSSRDLCKIKRHKPFG